MNRRDFIRSVVKAGAFASLDIDWDRILYVPGEKKIFLPSTHHITESEIVAAELARILPYVRNLFERDDIFYAKIQEKRKQQISGTEVSIPLITLTDK